MKRILLLSLFVFGLAACGSPSAVLVTGVDGSNSAAGDDPGGAPAEEMAPLLWESARPGSAEWSDFVFDLVGGELAPKLLPGSDDVETFCPRYRSMTNARRVNFWGMLVSAMVKYESGFNPALRYKESTMGTDAVTGAQVYSEGLLQMSYQDTQWYTFCEFDWSKDRNLSATDPRKTIFDPKKNLACGLRVLANQIAKKGLIAVTSGTYWAVITPGNKYNKLAEIRALVAKSPGCQ